MSRVLRADKDKCELSRQRATVPHWFANSSYISWSTRNRNFIEHRSSDQGQSCYLRQVTAAAAVLAGRRVENHTSKVIITTGEQVKKEEKKSIQVASETRRSLLWVCDDRRCRSTNKHRYRLGAPVSEIRHPGQDGQPDRFVDVKSAYFDDQGSRKWLSD